MNRAFRERHEYIVGALNGIHGFRCIPAAGAFYAFPNVSEAMRSKGIADDTAFSELLLKEGDVAVVPGSAFGAPGHIRLSFACSIETLQDAVSRIRRVLG
jgi:aspartate aminotransferase